MAGIPAKELGRSRGRRALPIRPVEQTILPPRHIAERSRTARRLRLPSWVQCRSSSTRPPLLRVGCARFRRHPRRARRLDTAGSTVQFVTDGHRERRCSSEIGCRPEVCWSARRPNGPAVPGRLAAVLLGAGVRLFDHLADTPVVLGDPTVVTGVGCHACALSRAHVVDHRPPTSLQVTCPNLECHSPKSPHIPYRTWASCREALLPI